MSFLKEGRLSSQRRPFGPTPFLRDVVIVKWAASCKARETSPTPGEETRAVKAAGATHRFRVSTADPMCDEAP